MRGLLVWCSPVPRRRHWCATRSTAVARREPAALSQGHHASRADSADARVLVRSRGALPVLSHWRRRGLVRRRRVFVRREAGQSQAADHASHDGFRPRRYPGTHAGVVPGTGCRVSALPCGRTVDGCGEADIRVRAAHDANGRWPQCRTVERGGTGHVLDVSPGARLPARLPRTSWEKVLADHEAEFEGPRIVAWP